AQDRRPIAPAWLLLRRALPAFEIDPLGHQADALGGNAVVARDRLAAVGAGRQHRLGLAGVVAFEPRERPQQPAAGAALVAQLFGEHAFDAHQVGRTAALARAEEAVDVEADDE